MGAVAIAVAAVMLMTGDDESAPVLVVAPEPTLSPPTAAPEIRVQVSGAVVSPGVYTMSEGDRVMDAVAAAGGVRPDANLSALNLARRVQDEAHYHIPVDRRDPRSNAPGRLCGASRPGRRNRGLSAGPQHRLGARPREPAGHRAGDSGAYHCPP